MLILNSLGSIPVSCHLAGDTLLIHTTTDVRIPSGSRGTHLYTLMENSIVIDMSCWRTKVPGIDGNRTRNPLIQSRSFSPIYHGTCIKCLPLNTLLKPKRHSLHCHGFMVHTLLLRMHTNVVCFRVMRRLPSRMKLTMREPTFMGSMTTDHVITACDVWL